MQRTGFILLLLLTMEGVGKAQDSIPPEIRVEERGDSVRFSARLRPLRQLAGAPTAYYSYFWELGDGRFSFDKAPLYLYRDTGVYQVRLYATNNYDDGKAPPTRPRPVKIKRPSNGSKTWASHFFHGNGNIEMKINRNPKPGEDFVTVIGYRNQSADSLGGSIVLFFNERQFGRDGLALADRRFYNREESGDLNTLLASLSTTGGSYGATAGEPVPAAPEEGLVLTDGGKKYSRGFSGMDTRYAGGQAGPGYDLFFRPEAAGYAGQARSLLRSLSSDFTQHTVLHYPAIRPGEEKFVFLEMNTLPGMIKDTNATVSLIAMLVPDNPAIAPQLHELDMQVVASHDPNRLQLIHRRINYRFMGDRKELDYRVNFQNTGKGPTRKISIGIAIPPELNSQSIRVKSMSPQCRWCDSAYKGQSCIDSFRRGDSIYFVFNNIYLPGLEQGVVADKDSTTGFVDFSIRFKKKPKKIPFSTRATIQFDGNEPVVTNKTTARFIKGISPGIIAGYNFLPAQGSYSATGPLQIGYVLAPYSPYRPYFQAEASVILLEQEQNSGVLIKLNQDTSILGQLYVITGRQSQTVTRRNSLDLTPLHFRYNLNNWIGLGVGATAQISLSEQTTTNDKIYFESKLLPLTVMTAITTQNAATRWIGSWKAEPFIDVQVGRVRTGPVVGLRYLRPLQGNLPDRFFLYAGFKL